MRLSSITIRGLANAAKMIVLTPIALLARRKHPSVWIVTERPDQARDNGYCFFKFVKEQHPEQDIYYIIDTRAKDYEKIKKYKDVIHFNSWKHYFYYCLSTVHISAHVGGCNPEHNPFAKRWKRVLNYIDVFIPHGVSYGVSEFCLAKYAKIDLFICSGRPEYDNVLANYGYSKDQVAYTGFPRLDGWHDIQIDPHLIVLMPTWRLYLAQNPNTVFEETTYYKAYQDLINSPELKDTLEKHRLRMVFYLHHNMRKYVDCFHSDSSSVEIVYRDDQYDIQELLKSAALLITDYSSVHFDFAYMGKPVIYYQFDKEEFFARQYEKSIFDAEKDGFGPVCRTIEQLNNELKNCIQTAFRVDAKYNDHMRDFYQLYDMQNSERVYAEINAKLAK